MLKRGVEICRDEDCPIETLHSLTFCEFVFERREKPRWPHHKRRLQAMRGKLALWQRPDHAGLSEAVLRAVPDQPTIMRWIARDVRDDYGTVADRTIYRYVRKLVGVGSLVKVDIGLNFAAYTRPRARLLGDIEALRDYMLGLVEITACAKDSIA